MDHNKKLQRHQAYHARLSELDEAPDNPIPHSGLKRRTFVSGGLGLAISSLFLSSGCDSEPTQHKTNPVAAKPLMGFKPIPVQQAVDFDQVVVPEGYSAKVFFAWGDPVEADAEPWRADAGNSWQEQLKQAGQNHDGMHFFPFSDAPNDHGLLVINHEYVNPTLHEKGFSERFNSDGHKLRPVAEVKKEQAAHGVSIIEIKRDAKGDWQRIYPSQYNRRISALTTMQLTGPAAGSEQMKTAADPSGAKVIGTINNCAMGWTPWGTYLTCEENWKNYFVNRNPEDYKQRVAHQRYGVSTGNYSAKYAWESVDPRFNATPDSNQPHQGYVNEPNRFGWVVEIDPFDPTSTPKKRTAMGRLVRECSTLSLGSDNRMAFYFGDDTRGEYIYKFVPSKAYSPQDNAANRDILDDGILYVAVFNDDGSGEWRPLAFGEPVLSEQTGFTSQAQVLVNARAAADLLGATTMDRPEWIAVNPHNKEVYATLTNNKHRGVKPGHPLNAANPRKENLHGQIIRWREANQDPTATEFEWDLFLLAGEDGSNPETPAHLTGNIKGDIFSSPDGLWFDNSSRLWIETDYDDGAATHQMMGTNQLLCADPDTKQVKRFLAGPRGCEITGLTATPDNKTFWVNIQHPGISFPASDGKTRPRSATLVITKDDGGVIGS